MAVYDGAKEAQDHLLDVARGVVQAYMKAPQITGRVALKSVILTGDDLLPVIEMFEELGKIVNFINISAGSYRKAYDAGQPPVLVLLGADVSKSELAWDCGSCGFKTCAEFNAFSKKNRGMGKVYGGPSCNWKYMDYNVAACWACDAASKLNIENRLEGSSGLISQILGYLADCSVVNGLPLGPCTDIWYYSRPSFKVEYETWRQTILSALPHAALNFVGPGIPMVKAQPDWWNHRTFIKVQDVPEYGAAEQAMQEKIGEVFVKYKDKVQENVKNIEAQSLKKLG